MTIEKFGILRIKPNYNQPTGDRDNGRKEIEMSTYLVMLHHEMDDLPLAIFSSYDDAKSFADNVEAMPDDRTVSILDADCSTPNCVSVVTFVDGVLSDRTVVRQVRRQR